MDNTKIFNMSFNKVYTCLINKALRKNHTKEEVFELTSWLTGYPCSELEALLNSNITYAEFFNNAPHLNPNRELIKGSICGINIEEIEEPLMKEIRYLDKIIDELTKGKDIEKIKRK